MFSCTACVNITVSEKGTTLILIGYGDRKKHAANSAWLYQIRENNRASINLMTADASNREEMEVGVGGDGLPRGPGHEGLLRLLREGDGRARRGLGGVLCGRL